MNDIEEEYTRGDYLRAFVRAYDRWQQLERAHASAMTGTAYQSLEGLIQARRELTAAREAVGDLE